MHPHKHKIPTYSRIHTHTHTRAKWIKKTHLHLVECYVDLYIKIYLYIYHQFFKNLFVSRPNPLADISQYIHFVLSLVKLELEIKVIHKLR